MPILRAEVTCRKRVPKNTEMLVCPISDDDESTRGSLVNDECDREREYRVKPATSLKLVPHSSTFTGAPTAGMWPQMWIRCGMTVTSISTVTEDTDATATATHSSDDKAHIALLVGRGGLREDATGSVSDGPICFLDLASVGGGPNNGDISSARRHQVSRYHAMVEAAWKWCPSHQLNVGAWKLESLVVCDRRSLFGTCCNSVRLVPMVRTHIAVDCGGHPPQLVFGGRHGVQLDFECVAPQDAIDTILPSPPAPVSVAVVVDACAQTDDVTQTNVRGKKAAQTAPTQQQRQRSRSNANAAPPGEGSARKSSNIIIVDDDESVPKEVPHQHQTNAADDENASILETQLRRRQSLRFSQGPLASDVVGQSVSTCTIPADHHNRALTIVTTGTRLTADERKSCERISLTVNPPMSEFHTATYLVMEPPLVRSVKLMTAIPFVEAFLHRSWLDAVFASGRMNVPVQRHLYSETYTRRGIEAANGFRIDELAAVPPAKRQTLLKGFSVFVHAQAQPQDEPHNDLKHVVAASGGIICARMAEADLIVLPTAPLAPRERKSLQDEGYHAEAVVITVEDLFRAVLQQKRPSTSTLSWADPDTVSKRKRGRAASPRQRNNSLK
jgi:hypothetical protein